MAVMCGVVVLDELVEKVGVPYLPEDDELAMLDEILNPVEGHVYGFGAALLDRLVGNTSGGDVVSGDRGGCL